MFVCLLINHLSKPFVCLFINILSKPFVCLLAYKSFGLTLVCLHTNLLSKPFICWFIYQPFVWTFCLFAYKSFIFLFVYNSALQGGVQEADPGRMQIWADRCDCTALWTNCQVSKSNDSYFIVMAKLISEIYIVKWRSSSSGGREKGLGAVYKPYLYLIIISIRII